MIETIVLAATAPIWVPWLVGAVLALGGTLSTIAAFFIGRSKKKPNNTEKELAQLRKEQIALDTHTREEANHLAEDTHGQVKTLMKQSNHQQHRLELTMQTLNEEVQAVDVSRKQLDAVVTDLQSTTTDSAITMKKILEELEQLKKELILVNDKLRNTQEELSNKEHELNTSLIKNINLQEQLTRETGENQERVRELSKQIEVFSMLNEEINPAFAIFDAEKKCLSATQTTMDATIKKLEFSLERLTSALKTSKKSEATQLSIIKTLIDENKKLRIASLGKVDSQSQGTSVEERTSHIPSMRLFG